MSVNKLKKFIDENVLTVSIPVSELKNLIEGFRENNIQFDDIINYLQRNMDKVTGEHNEKENKKREEHINFQSTKEEAKNLITNALTEARYNLENSTIKSIIKFFIHHYEGEVGEALEELVKAFSSDAASSSVIEKIKPRLAPHKWKSPLRKEPEM